MTALQLTPGMPAHARFLMDARRRPSYARQVLEPLRAAIEALRKTDPHRASRATECLIRHELAIHSADASDTAHIWLTATQEIVGQVPAGATSNLGALQIHAFGLELEESPPTPSQHVDSEIQARRRIQNDRKDARYRTCVHEGGHLIAMLQAGWHDNIRNAAIFDSSRNGTLAHVMASFGGMSDGTKAKILAAGGAATSLLFASVNGAAADMEDLRGISVTVGDVDTASPYWELSENDAMRELRKSVEHELEADLRFLWTLADELYARGRLEGDEIRSAWANYKAGGLGPKLFA